MKNRPIDILIGIVLVYLLLGLFVVSVQGLSGAACGPVRLGGYYVYEVNREAPRFWLWRAIHWLPNAYDNLVVDDVPLSQFIAPRECLWVPEGMSPDDVEPEERSLGDTGES